MRRKQVGSGQILIEFVRSIFDEFAFEAKESCGLTPITNNGFKI